MTSLDELSQNLFSIFVVNRPILGIICQKLCNNKHTSVPTFLLGIGYDMRVYTQYPYPKYPFFWVYTQYPIKEWVRMYDNN